MSIVVYDVNILLIVLTTQRDGFDKKKDSNTSQYFLYNFLVNCSINLKTFLVIAIFFGFRAILIPHNAQTTK